MVMLAAQILFGEGRRGDGASPGRSRAVSIFRLAPVTLGLWLQATILAIATDPRRVAGAVVVLKLLFGVSSFPAARPLPRPPSRSSSCSGAATGAPSWPSLASSASSALASSPTSARVHVDVDALHRRGSCLGFEGDEKAPRRPSRSPACDGRCRTACSTRTWAPRRARSRCATTTTSGAAPLCFERVDVGAVAMGLAARPTYSTPVVAASCRSDATGNTEVDTIEGRTPASRRCSAGGAPIAFAVVLLASGLSSSSVGTYVGKVVMEGFIESHGSRSPVRGGDHHGALCAARVPAIRRGRDRRPGGLAGRARCSASRSRSCRDPASCPCADVMGAAR